MSLFNGYMPFIRSLLANVRFLWHQYVCLYSVARILLWFSVTRILLLASCGANLSVRPPIHLPFPSPTTPSLPLPFCWLIVPPLQPTSKPASQPANQHARFCFASRLPWHVNLNILRYYRCVSCDGEKQDRTCDPKNICTSQCLLAARPLSHLATQPHSHMAI